MTASLSLQILFCALVFAMPQDLVVVTRNSPVWNLSIAEFNAAPYENTSPLARAVYFTHTASAVVDAVQQILAGQSSMTELKIQARSGRHSYTALAATTLNAAVVDVSNLTKMEEPVPIDCPTSMGSDSSCFSIEVGPGWRMFDLYYALYSRHGLMFSGGTDPTVGISGYVLGGGYGYYSRQYGLGSDNLLGAEVVSVLENQTIVRKWADDNLLWALRGGGNNNFGIVTSMKLRVFRVPQYVSYWKVMYPSSICESTVFRKFEIEAPSSPADVNIAFLVFSGANSECGVTITLLNHTAEDVEEFVGANGWLTISNATPATSVPVQHSWIGMVLDYAGCSTVNQCLSKTQTEWPNPAKPLHWEAFSAYVMQPVSDSAEALSALWKAIRQSIAGPQPPGSTMAMLMIDSYGGQINYTNSNLSFGLLNRSFPHGQALYHCQILGYWNTVPEGGSSTGAAAVRAWITDVFTAVDSYIPDERKAAYRNYPNFRLPNARQRYYGASLKGLVELRKQMDPLSLFTYNQSV